MIRRAQTDDLLRRMDEPRRTIQVIAGPRQVGKTTMVKQLLKDLNFPSLYLNADAVGANDKQWIRNGWLQARAQVALNRYSEYLLVFDEIHKIDNWSEQVKREWDDDTFNDINIKVILLGSSRLLLKKGLTESLAGRYEIVPMSHWSFAEMQRAFGWDIAHYVYFGGYPGSAPYINSEARWRRYMRESIISPAIEKDVLQTTHIYKPSLLNQLFCLGCSYSGELVAINKLLGSLQDAGNATTLTNYLGVLGESRLLVGLQKFSKDMSRKYRSIPKLQVFNNALLTAMSDGVSYEKVFTDPQLWGRWVESAVGCFLLDRMEELEYNLFYWRDGNDEVDFVITRGEKVVAIEVKSGRRQYNSGLSVFGEKYAPQYSLVVGGNSMPLEQFLTTDLSQLL